jgi:hypothetical protein
MRKCGALGEVALPMEIQRFMGSPQFLSELHADHEPRSVSLTLALSRREREYRGRFMGSSGE